MKFENIEVGESDRIRIPIPENYPDCLVLLNSDLYRLSGKEKSLPGLLLYIFTHPFSFTVWLRLCSYKGIFYYPFKLMHKFCSNLRQIDISPSTKIGYGLYLGHRRCMVVNEHTIIGNNVNLSQFLNIGTNHRTPATIGDKVYIGPNVCIVEDVKVGSCSAIGAGAVVTKDVPQGSTCAGVPAKVLHYNTPARYIGNPWLKA